jgi:hypothetical protein
METMVLDSCVWRVEGAECQSESESEQETVAVETQKQVFELWRKYLEGARLVLVQIKEPRYKRVRLVQPLPGVQLCVGGRNVTDTT